MFVNPCKAQKIVAATCSLHNYMMKTIKDIYCPPGCIDTYDMDGNLIPGPFRSVLPSNSIFNTEAERNDVGGRPLGDAVKQRDHLKFFFNSQEGQLDWQQKSIFNLLAV